MFIFSLLFSSWSCAFFSANSATLSSLSSAGLTVSTLSGFLWITRLSGLSNFSWAKSSNFRRKALAASSSSS
uniref:Secreted protein n=1 Tax=Anguilla anguilla TaxID=7936 RepID=A0A0E9RPX2_ANGAN